MALIDSNSAMAPAKLGQALAKGVGIDTGYRARNEPSDAVRSAATSLESVELYEEEDVTVKEWLQETLVPSKDGVLNYFRSLFPFWSWIFHYNVIWLIGDVIAGRFL